MKQRGFTLSEVLVAIAIIGVIAAITLPMANKYRPDTSKVLYLNSYDGLRLAIANLAENNDVYPEVQNDLIFSKYPFANTLAAKLNGQDIAAGRNKLCRALAASFNILEDASEIASDTSNACSNSYKAYEQPDDFNLSFTNKNGVEFMVTTQAAASPSAGANQSYETDVIIDINGNDNAPNCTWPSCKKPDRFIFKISADGEVRALDAAGIYYLETRKSLKQKDIEETALVKSLLTENQKDFDPFTINSITTNNNEGDNTSSGNDNNDNDDNKDNNSSGNNGNNNENDNNNDDSGNSSGGNNNGSSGSGLSSGGTGGGGSNQQYSQDEHSPDGDSMQDWYNKNGYDEDGHKPGDDGYKHFQTVN